MLTPTPFLLDLPQEAINAPHSLAFRVYEFLGSWGNMYSFPKISLRIEALSSPLFSAIFSIIASKSFCFSSSFRSEIVRQTPFFFNGIFSSDKNLLQVSGERETPGTNGSIVYSRAIGMGSLSLPKILISSISTIALTLFPSSNISLLSP